MKVLVVNWAWYPTGGDWTYIENLSNLYEQNGFEIIPFSTENPNNVKTKYPDNFVKSPDYKLLNKNKNLLNTAKAIRNSIISFDALKKLDQILKQQPDLKLAHLHNIHHYITPAIIWRLKEAGIKIMWSLHDYKIICPDSLFISNGKLCEKCITGNFYSCAVNKCKKGSFGASAIAAIEAYFYHSKKVYQQVDAFLCPSQFLKKKFMQFGFPEDKFFVSNTCYDVSVIDNFINTEFKLPATNDYILYVGRIEYIKGIITLIDAIKGTGIKLKIVGSGVLETELKEYCAAQNIVEAEFLGFKNKAQVFELTYNARLIVCPSVCYENFPFAVVESFLFSKPAIGSRIGGIPELIIDGETGFLFEPGNPLDLREKLLNLWNDEQLLEKMKASTRNHAYKLVNFNAHWDKLKAVIDNLLIT